MSFTINIGKVTKKYNSTYQPTTELNQTFNVVLKDSSSDYSPTFVLYNPINTWDYNYLKWGDWYYYITNVIRDKNHMITITCVLDFLATFKSNIINSVQYVLYDGTANTEIPDRRLSTVTTMTVSQSSVPVTALNRVSPSVVLSCVGKNSVNSFVLTRTQVNSIINAIRGEVETYLDVPDPQDLSDVLEALAYIMDVIGKTATQRLTQPSASDCIKSAIILPCSSGLISESVGADIYLGGFDTGVNANFAKDFAQFNYSVSIPWQYTDWRRQSPYTHIYLQLPYIGLISLVPETLVGYAALDIDLSIDVLSGNILYRVNAGGHLIGYYTGNISSGYPIGSSNVAESKAFSSIIGGLVGSAVASATISNPVAGAVAVGASAITGFLGATMPMPMSIGGGGGSAFMDGNNNIICFTECHNTNVDPSSVTGFMGTPTMQVKSLSGLSGYVECKCASVAIPASDAVINKVNDALNGGIYIE